MIFYRTTTISNEIKEVESIKHSLHNIWIKNKFDNEVVRYPLRSKFDNYFESIEQAEKFINGA